MPFAPPGYEKSPLNGIDFSWVATDRDGHVAWLVTFGSAVVPSWMERQLETYEDVERLLERLPVVGDSVDDDGSHGVQQWADAARRGLFGYDWAVYRGPYRLIARPSAPIDVHQLGPALAATAARARFEHLCFRDSPAIQLTDVQACKQGD